MTGEFRGVEISQGQYSSSAGGPVPIQMPSDIVAGDWLIVAGGGYNFGFWDAPAGWFTISARSLVVKIADGSEAGATINFVTVNTTSIDSGSGDTTRAGIFAALCYRFPVAPVSGGGLGPNSAVHVFGQRGFGGFGSPQDSNDFGGNYPSSVSSIQFRFLMGQAQGDNGTDAEVPTGMTWYGDLIADRTGMYTETRTGPGLEDDIGASFADQFYLVPPANSNPDTGLIVEAPTNVAAFLSGFSLVFPEVPAEAYWGILAGPM